MKQWILIDDFCVSMVIGVYGWEQAITQPVRMNIKMAVDMTKAYLSDDINDAINYKQVCDDITHLCQRSRPHLLEHLAYQLATLLFERYPCQEIVLVIKKPHAIKNADVGVHIEMTRQQFLSFDA